MESMKKHPYLVAFLVSLLLGILVVFPSIVSGRGVFAFIDDFNQQEMPFNTYMNEAIKTGNVLFDFHNDLGASFIGSYSFYNLGSPFAIILWLFPSSIVPYLLGPMYALKYAIAGLTAFLFLNRFVKNKKYALLGSILYAFSGFQFTNMLFYHFHDCVAFFPLLLYSLDRLIKEDKKGLFTLSVALNLFTNYFFFIGQVVFVLLYYVIMNLTKYYHFTWKKFFQIALESILGVLLGCVLFIPTIYFVISNPRIGGNWTLSSMFTPLLADILEVIRALVFPNDNMTFHSAINMMNYGSVEAYLPFVGSILWLTYLVKKPKDSFSVFVLILFLFMLYPILNSSFFAFTKVYYARWFYMPTLFFSLLSIKTLEEKLDWKIGIWTTVGLLCLFIFLSIIYVYKGNVFSYQPGLFIFISVVLVLNIILLYCFMKSKKSFQYLLLGVCLYTVFYGNYVCFSTRILHQDEVGYEKRYQAMNQAVSSLENNVRYNHDQTCERNSLFYASKMSITSWNSNIEGSAFDFYNSLNIYREVLTDISIHEHDLQDFLSVKYIVSCKTPNEVDSQYELIKQEKDIYIYENKDYLPLGIPMTQYVEMGEYDNLSDEDKRKILKEAVILDKVQIEKYKEVLTPYSQEKSLPIMHSITFTKRGFQDFINVEQDTILVYSFPYSKGFKAYVNGEEVKIENVDHGLMGILISQGENTIEFTYFPPGLSLGISLSCVGFIGFVIYMWLERKKEV